MTDKGYWDLHLFAPRVSRSVVWCEIDCEDGPSTIQSFGSLRDRCLEAFEGIPSVRERATKDILLFFACMPSQRFVKMDDAAVKVEFDPSLKLTVRRRFPTQEELERHLRFLSHMESITIGSSISDESATPSSPGVDT